MTKPSQSAVTDVADDDHLMKRFLATSPRSRHLLTSGNLFCWQRLTMKSTAMSGPLTCM